MRNVDGGAQENLILNENSNITMGLLQYGNIW